MKAETLQSFLEQSPDWIMSTEMERIGDKVISYVFIGQNYSGNRPINILFEVTRYSDLVHCIKTIENSGYAFETAYNWATKGFDKSHQSVSIFVKQPIQSPVIEMVKWIYDNAVEHGYVKADTQSEFESDI